MATTKSIPTVPALPPAAAALPDLETLGKAARAQSNTLAEALAAMESSLLPYIHLPGADTHRFAHGMLSMVRLLAVNPRGCQDALDVLSRDSAPGMGKAHVNL